MGIYIDYMILFALGILIAQIAQYFQIDWISIIKFSNIAIKSNLKTYILNTKIFIDIVN